MIDRFWDNMEANAPIYLDDKLIKWCGYKGDKKTQKTNFIKFMKRNNIEITELETPEYIKYYKESSHSLKGYKNPKDISKNSTNEVHVLISAFNFKRMVMRLKTNKGDTIRDYFLLMEILVIYYMKYQCRFLDISYKKEIDKLKMLHHIKTYSRMQRVAELDAEIKDKYRIGVVYYICEEDNLNIVKIGYTFDLVGRLAALQTAHYKELIVKKYHFAQFPREEERRLHDKYKNNLIRGEWYWLKN
jgi:hypothetical protein